MDTASDDDFHLKEYEKLREEILLHFKEIFRTDTFFLVAIIAYYAWLATHPEMLSKHWIIPWLPMALPIAGFFRYVGLLRMMMAIGKYIQVLEGNFLGDIPHTPGAKDAYGWERFLSLHRSHWFMAYQFLFWVLLFVMTILAPYLVFRSDIHTPPVPAAQSSAAPTPK
jgi:hypothetical protein